jgi:hypothetical protein
VHADDTHNLSYIMKFNMVPSYRYKKARGRVEKEQQIYEDTTVDKKNKGIGSQETRDCDPGSFLGASWGVTHDCDPGSSLRASC